jgi:hypothetical protein
MARRGSTSGTQRAGSLDRTFAVAERTVIGLYDAGVLSPVVLERVLLGFMQSDIDWTTLPAQQSADGRSLHEVVATTMIPGRTTRSPSKDFLLVVEHLRGTSAVPSQVAEEPADPDDDDLLSQLGGGATQRNAVVRPSRRSQPPAGFNPLLGATSPSRKSAK